MENPLVLEREDFKQIMIEAQDLLNLAMKKQNNLMHPENMFIYDTLAPYIINDDPDRYESPGYKIGFLQAMSIAMALREKNNKQINPINIKDNIVNFNNYKNIRRKV